MLDPSRAASLMGRNMVMVQSQAISDGAKNEENALYGTI